MEDSYKVISEVFIGDPVKFRRDIFDCWLEDLPIEEAVKRIKDSAEEKNAYIDEDEDLSALVRKDISDSYRIFDFFKESLSDNSWNIVYFKPEEKRFMCEAYFKLDDSIIKEILNQGIGEKKRSIMLTNKQIDKRVLEAMKCMRNYITSLDNNLSIPLLQLIQNRFYISKKTAESYLCLLFLLSDNTDSFLDWSILKTITWFVLCHWTIGTEYLASEYSADIEGKSINPVSLELSTDFLEAMKDISMIVEKKIDSRNWTGKTDRSSNNQIIKRISLIMNELYKKKGRVKSFCEYVNKQLNPNIFPGMSICDLQKKLGECAKQMEEIAPQYTYYINSFIKLCSIYLESNPNIQSKFSQSQQQLLPL